MIDDDGAERSSRRAGAEGEDPARARIERESDQLIQWAAERFGPPDPADPANVDFYDWWAGELRARENAAERAESERRAGEFAARVAARASSGLAGLRSIAGRPAGARRDADATTLRQAIAVAERGRAAVIVDHAVAAGSGRDLWDEPAERWVDLPDDVPDGRYVVLTVAGESMQPALHPGDSVLVRVGPELARHSIVVARRPDDGYVVKRVGAMTRRHVELLSLNPSFAPVRIPRDERLVVGTVVLRWCEHGT